jgi:hypothetical protein
VRENVDDDISTQQYFPRPYREDGRELETGLMTAGANSSLLVRREGTADEWDLETLAKRTSKLNKKFPAASLLPS